MRWDVLGHVLDPRTEPRVRSHAQVPTPLLLEDRIRVWFADRDAEGRSHPRHADLDRNDPMRLLDLGDTPSLGHGAPGTFDDDGVMPACALHVEGRVRLYYSGWNQRVRVPYHNATGVAESTDGRHFLRLHEGPIMDRCPTEPYLAVTPSILREVDTWRAWYVSGIRWDRLGERYEPIYVIKHATSADGIHWLRPPDVCVPQAHPQEAFSHPTVVRVADTYLMWFCSRDSADYRGGSGSYRMGFAHSADGVQWTRDDARAGIDCREDGWSDSMVCYPSVILDDDTAWMFYNGNGFGRTGMGIARAAVSDLAQLARSCRAPARTSGSPG